jgi:hypothetical protein
MKSIPRDVPQIKTLRLQETFDISPAGADLAGDYLAKVCAEAFRAGGQPAKGTTDWISLSGISAAVESSARERHRSSDSVVGTNSGI